MFQTSICDVLIVTSLECDQSEIVRVMPGTVPIMSRIVLAFPCQISIYRFYEKLAYETGVTKAKNHKKLEGYIVSTIDPLKN